MNRRNFFAGIAGFFGLTLTPLPAKELRSEYGLGKYKRHMLEFVAFDEYETPWPVELERGIRYVQFPIEARLTIVYEKGEEKYHSFHPEKKLVCKINEMTGEELLSYRTNDIYDKYVAHLKIDDKKFVLGSIWYKNEEG